MTTNILINQYIALWKWEDFTCDFINHFPVLYTYNTSLSISKSESEIYSLLIYLLYNHYFFRLISRIFHKNKNKNVKKHTNLTKGSFSKIFTFINGAKGVNYFHSGTFEQSVIQRTRYVTMGLDVLLLLL